MAPPQSGGVFFNQLGSYIYIIIVASVIVSHSPTRSPTRLSIFVVAAHLSTARATLVGA